MIEYRLGLKGVRYPEWGFAVASDTWKGMRPWVSQGDHCLVGLGWLWKLT